MRSRLARSAVAAALSGLIVYIVAVSQAVAPRAGMESIRVSELREKVFYLASSELKGRGNGAPELRTAAEYIAEAFQRNGVRPAGDGGTYFQDFEMFTGRLGPANEFSVGGNRLLPGIDFVPHYLSPKGSVQAPMTFVGYGVTAPHLGFDELRGVNLRGRIAVAIDRNPRPGDFASSFNRIHPSDFASVTTKARNVYEAGAVALIIIQDPAVPDFSVPQLQQTFSPGYSRRFVPMGNVSDPANPSIPVIVLSWDAGRRIVSGLSGLKQRIDTSLRPLTVDLGPDATLRVDVDRDTFGTQNVLGLIEGSDPQLRRDVIVVGAHYDHDGESEGQIWPGADDNASGTSALLELAEAFGNGRPAPRRSILLAAFAGEEKGQIGSHHYVAHPVFPAERTTGMFQLDMIGRNEEHPANPRLGLDRETSAGNANQVNIIGSTFSPEFTRYVQDVNRQIGLQLDLRYDHTPEVLLRRSDQWPFLQKRIPALFVHTGEHPDYHRPTDTADKINYPKLEKIVRMVYLAVERSANDPARPRFVEP